MTNYRSASSLFNSLSGVFCVYKPAHLTFVRMKALILGHICSELNEISPDLNEKMVTISGATNQTMSVEVTDNYASHPLVAGPRYLPEDFKFSAAPLLGKDTSGVCLIGIGNGVSVITKCKYAQLTRAFKVHGVLGAATETFYKDGKIIEKASYKKIDKGKMDKVISYIQSAHQKKMFDLLGVDIQSQTAYEMAKEGPVRPYDERIPVLYGIRCVYLDPPNFIIEIQSINEYEKYLHNLIHDIGLQLRSVAHCTAVQCIRYGKFTIDHAILRKHWTFENILQSIDVCNKVLEKNKSMLNPPAILK